MKAVGVKNMEEIWSSHVSWDIQVVLAVDNDRDGEGNCNGSAKVLKEWIVPPGDQWGRRDAIVAMSWTSKEEVCGIEDEVD